MYYIYSPLARRLLCRVQLCWRVNPSLDTGTERTAREHYGNSVPGSRLGPYVLNRHSRIPGTPPQDAERIPPWPLQDIVINNIVWCMACTREVRGGVVYCPIAVQ